MSFVIFNDPSLIAIHKPSGLNTHRPDDLAPEGVYEWLQRHFPLFPISIAHRLDKETSGVLVFPASSHCANVSGQFERREIRKTYFFLTRGKPPNPEWSSTNPVQGQKAQTRFVVDKHISNQLFLCRAYPISGRTHQIRQHAAASGVPILGDTPYGGPPASRLFLHSQQLIMKHPVTGKELVLEAPFPESFLNPDKPWEHSAHMEDPDFITTAHRFSVKGFSKPVTIEQLGEVLLIHDQQVPDQDVIQFVASRHPGKPLYLKKVRKEIRGELPAQEHLAGPVVESAITVKENGLTYKLSLAEGYSTGLFSDQRENRFSLMNWARSHQGTPKVLNLFSYTCSFSVAAAAAGASTVSVDLSKKYLDWGRENFALNNMPLENHDFIFGDVFDWLKRLGKRQGKYDLIIVDPPTFSTSKKSGSFRVEKDFPELIKGCLQVMTQKGKLLCSTNNHTWPPAAFAGCISSAVRNSGWKVTDTRYQSLPFDFLITEDDPVRPYLKTLWLDVEKK
ncbi:MAG: class I SAM-dependent methyltransferase [Verrucomicrobiota bacterium]|nr:class I SAM-dependent methyltransferase [Verrucomicrobiota bacterium]